MEAELVVQKSGPGYGVETEGVVMSAEDIQRESERHLGKVYQTWSTKKLRTSLYLRARDIGIKKRQMGHVGYSASWALLDAISRGIIQMEGELGILPWEHRRLMRSAIVAEKLYLAKKEVVAEAKKEEAIAVLETYQRLGYDIGRVIRSPIKAEKFRNALRRTRRMRKIARQKEESNDSPRDESDAGKNT